MPKTPSLGHCIKNTCFWYILSREGSVRKWSLLRFRLPRENPKANGSPQIARKREHPEFTELGKAVGHLHPEQVVSRLLSKGQ